MADHILIIEDNAVNLELLVFALNAFGFSVKSAMSAEQGLGMVRQESPAIILSDIQMPGMDGYELARTLKADPALRHIPLVGVSALALAGDRERALHCGFDDYVFKPVDFQLLREVLSRFAVVA
jgi:CheY-like chemotaxis protein